MRFRFLRLAIGVLAARGKRCLTLSGHAVFKANRLPSKGSDTFFCRLLAVTAVVLLTNHCRAHWYELGPSKDEWGLKYDGELEAAPGDKLTVQFTIADQGRLKPIHSVFVMAFSNPDSRGSRTYLVKTPIDMKPTTDGKLNGHVQIGKEFASRAVIRIFTETVDGRSQTAGPTAGARYYDIPLKKFLKKAPASASFQVPPSIASPPASTATK
ncbi:MAG: hypothetical protein JSS49_03920 [Planctomycetes bacterium]|nr:hypothetical protein [Planctomycetota bacterium]